MELEEDCPEQGLCRESATAGRVLVRCPAESFGRTGLWITAWSSPFSEAVPEVGQCGQGPTGTGSARVR